MDTPKTVQEQSTKANEKTTPQPQPQSLPAVDKPVVEKSSDKSKGAKRKSTVKAKPRQRNNVRRMRMERMMSKAELARRAGLSTLTIDRVEKGMSCRMDTKRKILEALGLTPSDRTAVFGDDD